MLFGRHECRADSSLLYFVPSLPTHPSPPFSGISVWRIAQGRTGYLHGRNDPFSQEFFWWSILFGPLGCYVRYYLSRFNSALHGSWKWFPVGTFTANMVACIIDYVMKCIPVRHPLDGASAAVLAGVIGGVGGCLSTVSTWVVEVRLVVLASKGCSSVPCCAAAGRSTAACSYKSPVLLLLLVGLDNNVY